MIQWHKISCQIKYEQIICSGNSQEGYLKLDCKEKTSGKTENEFEIALEE